MGRIPSQIEPTGIRDFRSDALESYPMQIVFARELTSPTLATWTGLLEAWLALTSVKYHGNLLVLIPFN